MSNYNTIDMVYHIPSNHNLIPSGYGSTTVMYPNPTYNINSVVTVANYAINSIITLNGKRYFNFLDVPTRNIRVTTTTTNNTNIQFECEFILKSTKRHFVYGISTAGTHTVAAVENMLFRVYVNNAANHVEVMFGATSYKCAYTFKNDSEYHILVTCDDNGLIVNINGECISNFDSVATSAARKGVTTGLRHHFISNPMYSGTAYSDYFGGYITGIYSSIGYYMHREHKDYKTTPYNKLLSVKFDNTKYNSDIKIVDKIGLSNISYDNSTKKITSPIIIPSVNKFDVRYTIKSNGNMVDNIIFDKGGVYKVTVNVIMADVIPTVIVGDNTTSALDFEDGIVDKIDTTVWNKSGTAGVTTSNVIYGENSFETKALGDGLYTNSPVITGGSTPFTIEFYCLISGIDASSASSQYMPLMINMDHINNNQGLHRHRINGNIVYYSNNSSNHNIIANKKINFNEINKITLTYDTACLRVFINDVLESVIGQSNYTPYINTVFLYNSDYFSDDKRVHKGLIDNINIHDGIATKVRDPDPYEEYLVVDLAFDGENNSTKIVDNAWNNPNYIEKYKKTVVWERKGNNAIISTIQPFDGFSSLYLNGSSWLETNLENNNVNVFNFSGTNDFTFSFDLIMKTSDRCSLFKPNWDGSAPAGIEMYIYQNKIYCNGWMYNDGQYKTVSLGGVKTININTKYNISLVRKDMVLSLYVNGQLDSTVNQLNEFVFDSSINYRIGADQSRDNDKYGITNRLNGYIKNFKIYKDVAVIPENPTGKIQLDFDNNVVDKYGNSTWTNNGVTFDQVDSVKGHAAYFNGNSTTTLTSSSASLNMGMNNFVFEYDNYRTLKAPSNLQMYIFANSIAPVGGTGSNIRITKGATTDNIDTTFMTYDTVPANRTYPSNNDYVNTWYNDRFVKKQSTILSYKNDVIYDCINDSTSNFNFISGGSAVFGKRSDWGTSYKGYIDNFNTYKEDLLTNNDITIFTDPAVTVNYKILDECLYVTGSGATSSSNGTSIIRLNDSPSLKNFTAEIELYFDATNIYMYGGLIFRTIEYKIRTHQMGYLIYFTVTGGKTHLRFGKGSNSSSDLWAQIHTVDVDSYRNNTYRILKVIAKDNNFKAYIDNILIFDVIDDSYDIASQFGMNSFNYFNTAMYSKTKRVNIWDENENNVYYKDWESKIDYVVDRPAVHLPLETNAINTGFTPLTVNSVGSPTYTVVDGKKCISFEKGKYLSIASNNIFNLGTTSDFYIEFDFFHKPFDGSLYESSSFANNSTSASTLCAIICQRENYTDERGQKVYLYLNGNTEILSTNMIIIGVWNNVILKRKNDDVSLILNGIETKITKKLNLSFDNACFSKQAWVDNASGTKSSISNFKMFVGTSQPPETYNDKKVLDLDFKPTRKSYLFKDNNNKCVIHPVNITQRDYQDSQYCCTFNGTNQYLQLGKNDLLNFGLDDFVLYFKVSVDVSDRSNVDQVLIYNDVAWASGSCGVSRYAQTNKLTIGVYGTTGFISDNEFVNGINEIIIIRSGTQFKIILNDIETVFENFSYQINLNANNNTLIGRAWLSSTQTFFKGYIYSIKFLRNTTDLSLLDGVGSSKVSEYTLENLETNAVETIVSNATKDVVNITDDGVDLSLTVNGVTKSLPSNDTADNIELFTNYDGQVTDELFVYDAVATAPDTFEIPALDYTPLPLTLVGNNTSSYFNIDTGYGTIDAFTEGHPNAKFVVVNRYTGLTMVVGVDTIYKNGVNLTAIANDYVVELTDLGISYPITPVMVRGYLTYNMSAENACRGSDYCIKLSRRDTGRLVGTYDFDTDGTCLIDNLDCNAKYDALLFDRNDLFESITISNRVPRPY